MTKNKPLQSLTALEAEKQSKRTAHEELEKIKETGQRNEKKAAKVLRQLTNQEEAKESLEKEEFLYKLTKLRKNRLLYSRFLLGLYFRFLADEDISKKYQFINDVTKDGVSVKIKGTNFIGAFKPSGEIRKDLMFVKVLAVRTGNTVAKLEGYIRKSEGGVLLPDRYDTKKYVNNT